MTRQDGAAAPVTGQSPRELAAICEWLPAGSRRSHYAPRRRQA